MSSSAPSWVGNYSYLDEKLKFLKTPLVKWKWNESRIRHFSNSDWADENTQSCCSMYVPMCIHSWNDLIDQTTPILPQIMETIMEKIGVCRLSIEHVTYERGTNKVMPHCVKRRPQNALSQEIVVRSYILKRFSDCCDKCSKSHFQVRTCN